MKGTQTKPENEKLLQKGRPQTSLGELLDADDLTLARILGLLLLFLLPYSFVYLLFPTVVSPQNFYAFILYVVGLAGIFSALPLISNFGYDVRRVSRAKEFMGIMDRFYEKFGKTIEKRQKEKLDRYRRIIDSYTTWSSEDFILRTVAITWLGFFFPTVLKFVGIAYIGLENYAVYTLLLIWVLTLFFRVEDNKNLNELKNLEKEIGQTMIAS